MFKGHAPFSSSLHWNRGIQSLYSSHLLLAVMLDDIEFPLKIYWKETKFGSGVEITRGANT
jgi:hypothetical protein